MPRKTQSILLAGVAVGLFSSIVSAIPVIGSCLFCLAYIAAGTLAVWHYTHTYDRTIPGGQGVGMGALASVIASAVSLLIGLTILFVIAGVDFDTLILRSLEAQGFEQEQIDEVRTYVQSPVFLGVSFLFFLFISAILGAVGGAIGAAIFKKGNEPSGSSPDTF